MNTLTADDDTVVLDDETIELLNEMKEEGNVGPNESFDIGED